ARTARNSRSSTCCSWLLAGLETDPGDEGAEAVDDLALLDLPELGGCPEREPASLDLAQLYRVADHRIALVEPRLFDRQRGGRAPRRLELGYRCVQVEPADG